MKYQKKSECPVPLDKWLERLKSVPHKTSLLSWKNIMREEYWKLTGESLDPLLQPSPDNDYGDWEPPTYEQEQKIEEATENALDRLKETTKEFTGLHNYLFVPEGKELVDNEWDEIRFDVKTRQYVKTAYERYETFIQMRRDIENIAGDCMYYRKKGVFVDRQSLFARFNSRRYLGDTSGYFARFVIKEGIIDFESELIQILRGVDPNRLKICPICKHVYWAKRVEAQVCSDKKCSNNFHQRQIRIKDYDARLDKEWHVLEKLRSELNPENSLIQNQESRINKLIEKSNREKVKNGLY